MDTLKKIWPYSFKEKKDIAALLINIVIQIVIDIVLGVVIGLLSGIPVLGLLLGIPVLGFIFGILGSVVGIYFLVGVVLSVLDYCKVLK